MSRHAKQHRSQFVFWVVVCAGNAQRLQQPTAVPPTRLLRRPAKNPAIVPWLGICGPCCWCGYRGLATARSARKSPNDSRTASMCGRMFSFDRVVTRLDARRQTGVARADRDSNFYFRRSSVRQRLGGRQADVDVHGVKRANHCAAPGAPDESLLGQPFHIIMNAPGVAIAQRVRRGGG